MEDQSETATPKLTLELITEILKRLPVKPLTQYKCVSKAWHSLIHSRRFILRNVTHSLSTTTNHHLTRLGRSTIATLNLPTPTSSAPLRTTTVRLPFSTRAPDSDFIGSCHGLFLISDHPNFLALFSPTTHTYRVLPTRVPQQGPESHWVDYGLGYDPASDDYKVVRVDQHNGFGAGSRAREVRVFSVKESRFKWRKIGVDFPGFLAHPKVHGKFLNKSLHWIASKSPPIVYDVETSMSPPRFVEAVYDYVIVGFDLSTENFNEIEMPPLSEAWWRSYDARPSLFVVGDKLLVQISYAVEEQLCVGLWMMKDYGVKESWVNLFTLEVPHKVSPMAISEEGGVGGLEVLFEKHDPKQSIFCWYNEERGEFRDVKVIGELPTLFEWRGGHPCCYGAVVYVDSLVRLNNAGLFHAGPPENPADDVTDAINEVEGLPLRSFRAHSKKLSVYEPGDSSLFVPLVGYGKRLP